MRPICKSISDLQTLNDMTRSMTAPLVHIKKLAKASNMKVGSTDGSILEHKYYTAIYDQLYYTESDHILH